MNTKSGLEATLKNTSRMAGIGLNERTRLKIALKEILSELGHDSEKIDHAINDVCNCDFRALRHMFNLPPGKTFANSGYISSYKERDVNIGDEYRVDGDDWWRVSDDVSGSVLTTDKLIVNSTDEERCHFDVFRNGEHFGMLHVHWTFLEKDFERVSP